MSGQEISPVNDAQIGLMVATPVIVVFAIVLYRMGALRLSGTISAVALSVAIATVLFLTQ